MEEIKSEPISMYLDFQPTVDNVVVPFIKSKDIAITNTGSTVYRCEEKRGRVFQLWLTADEFKKVKNSDIRGGVEFYGGNYIYLSPYSDLAIQHIAKLLKWKNKNYKNHGTKN